MSRTRPGYASPPYPLPWERKARGLLVPYRDVAGVPRVTTWCFEPTCIRCIDTREGSLELHGWTLTPRGYACSEHNPTSS